MKNLQQLNIFQDYGPVAQEDLDEIEKKNHINFPPTYKNFIFIHNGADLNARIFDYYDKSKEMQSSDSFAFLNVLQINNDIESLKKQNDPREEGMYFEEKLIPFGENGGGDFICFDYRNHDSNNPPIIMWTHGAPDNYNRVSFIANNFEEFINMLHEPED